MRIVITRSFASAEPAASSRRSRRRRSVLSALPARGEYPRPRRRSTGLRRSGSPPKRAEKRPADLADGAHKDNPWEGVGLLRELAEEGAAHVAPGGSLVLVMSSLCDAVARPWFDAKWAVEALATLEVPLKVYAVTSGLTGKSRRWLRYLEEAEGLVVHDPPRRGYATWQRLDILRCTPRG